MALTPAQTQTFSDDLVANTDPIVVQALADGNNNALQNFYNDDASPDYWIFITSVATEVVRDSINANDVVNITTGDLERVTALLSIRALTGFSGENADDRAAWDDVFSAAAGDNSQQTIAALWQRLATNIEMVFATSSGTGADAANSDTTTFQGDITRDDVRNAVALIP